MNYKIRLPLPRQRDTQSLFINGHGNIVSSILPGMDTPSENAFFRYTESVRIPRFRVEVERLTTVDVYPTVCTFFFPDGDRFERVDVTCSAITVPVFFEVPPRETPHHVAISDAGYVYVIFEQLTPAAIVDFQGAIDAGGADEICAPDRRSCLGYIRHAYDLTRGERNLEIEPITTP